MKKENLLSSDLKCFPVLEERLLMEEGMFQIGERMVEAYTLSTLTVVKVVIPACIPGNNC